MSGDVNIWGVIVSPDPIVSAETNPIDASILVESIVAPVSIISS